MAACFKLPSLAKRPKPKTQFPEFEWSEVTVEKELGSGTFGSVYLVKYEKEHRRNVIVKKMKGESAEARRRFEKEAAILKTVKGHRNVTEFLRFCREPYAIMMEHACFDFNPLGVKKQVNSLEDFLHFVDAEFDFTEPEQGSGKVEAINPQLIGTLFAIGYCSLHPHPSMIHAHLQLTKTPHLGRQCRLCLTFSWVTVSTCLGLH